MHRSGNRKSSIGKIRCNKVTCLFTGKQHKYNEHSGETCNIWTVAIREANNPSQIHLTFTWPRHVQRVYAEHCMHYSSRRSTVLLFSRLVPISAAYCTLKYINVIKFINCNLYFSRLRTHYFCLIDAEILMNVNAPDGRIVLCSPLQISPRTNSPPN